MSEIRRFVVLAFGSEAGGDGTAWKQWWFKSRQASASERRFVRGLWPNSTSIL